MDNNVKHIDVLIFDNVNILDIAGPVQAFKTAKRGNQPAYALRFVSLGGAPITACCGLKLMPDGPAHSDSPAEDLLIPGGTGVDKILTDSRMKELINGWLQGHENRQLKSVCSGSLLLANAGVLDGMDATTHWSRQQQAETDYPNVNWKMDQLYAFNERIATSAGVTSGIDMALAVIRKECSAQSALDVARELVVYLHRSGGQNQFTDVLEAQFSSNTSISKLTSTLSQTPQHPWTLDMMADFLGMTPRTLSRRFMNEVGLPPVRFLEKIRVKQACDTISAGMPVSKAIVHSGFGDFQRMQRAFKRQLGTTIGEYEKRFVVRV